MTRIPEAYLSLSQEEALKEAQRVHAEVGCRVRVFRDGLFWVTEPAGLYLYKSIRSA